MATRGFSKGVGDIGVEALDDSPPLVDADVDDVSKKKQVDLSHVTSNETRFLDHLNGHWFATFSPFVSWACGSGSNF
ncbi:hypothetical protein SO802_010740 [Lithocarpus litseifolius]|uniref:Uncharacterized protein n=1 Tax=Lithocarpus litseifolius TaxID=425828 RepID=A0AAW2DHP3_9ROSI